MRITWVSRHFRDTRIKLMRNAVDRARKHEKEAQDTLDWFPKDQVALTDVEGISRELHHAQFFWLVALGRFMYAYVR